MVRMIIRFDLSVKFIFYDRFELWIDFEYRMRFQNHIELDPDLS